jgi:hypothetical protein
METFPAVKGGVDVDYLGMPAPSSAGRTEL